jgi:hypothetical protein
MNRVEIVGRVRAQAMNGDTADDDSGDGARRGGEQRQLARQSEITKVECNWDGASEE